MSIEKHKCEGGDFHTTTDFLDCEECSAVIPNIPQADGLVKCPSCGTEFIPEDIADARVEEIVQAVIDAANLKDERDRLHAALKRVMSYAENELARMEENEFLPADKLVTQEMREDIAAARAALGEE